MSGNLEIADFQALTEGIGDNSEKESEKKLVESPDAEVTAAVSGSENGDQLIDDIVDVAENNIEGDIMETDPNQEDSNQEIDGDDTFTNNTASGDPDKHDKKENDNDDSEDDLLSSIVEVNSETPAEDSVQQDNENAVSDTIQSEQLTEPVEQPDNDEHTEGIDQSDDTQKSEDLDLEADIQESEDIQSTENNEQEDEDIQKTEDADLETDIQESEDIQSIENNEQDEDIQKTEDVDLETDIPDSEDIQSIENNEQDEDIQKTEDVDLETDIPDSEDIQSIENNEQDEDIQKTEDVDLDADILESEDTKQSAVSHKSEDVEPQEEIHHPENTEDTKQSENSNQDIGDTQMSAEMENTEDIEEAADIENTEDIHMSADFENSQGIQNAEESQNSDDIQNSNEVQMSEDIPNLEETEQSEVIEMSKEKQSEEMQTSDENQLSTDLNNTEEPLEETKMLEDEQLSGDGQTQREDLMNEVEHVTSDTQDKTESVENEDQDFNDDIGPADEPNLDENLTEKDTQNKEIFENEIIETGDTNDSNVQSEKNSDSLQKEKEQSEDDLLKQDDNDQSEGLPQSGDSNDKTEDELLKEDNEDDIADSIVDINEPESKNAAVEKEEGHDKVKESEKSHMDVDNEGSEEEMLEVTNDRLLANATTSASDQNGETDSGNADVEEAKTSKDDESMEVTEEEGSTTEITEAKTSKENESMEVDTEEKEDNDTESNEMVKESAEIELKISDVKTEAKVHENEEEKAEEKKTNEDNVKPGETESSKDSETDNTMGLKIVGVTSAVGLEEKAEQKAEQKVKAEDDSGNLNLKISSVSGSTDIEGKTVVKKEPIEPVKEDKKNNAENKKKESKPPKGKVEEDDDVIAIKEEKKPAPKPRPSKIQTCIVCKKVGKCKYNIVRNGDVKHLCDDLCFKRFRSSPTTYLKQAETVGKDKEKMAANAPTVQKPVANSQVSAARPAGAKTNQGQGQVLKTCNVCQLLNVRTSKPFLNWMGLDFCGEECLGKFQGSLSLTCSYCQSHIPNANKAKHCWRGGSEVKHFCSLTCNNEFVKRMKLCAFCNKDLSVVGDSFMAPVGSKGTFRDFCSQKCLQQFEEINNDMEVTGMENGKGTAPPKGNFLCAVCGKNGPVKHEIKHSGKSNRLCSDPCFSAFQYANKLTINNCHNCGNNVPTDSLTAQFIQFEGQQKKFCSFICVNTFRNTNRKIVPCGWCGLKKNNFDMIERVDANNKYQLFCSLNCLSLYRVNLQATSNQAVVCDQCRKYVPAQYHLTMSDASVRNFCSYGCVMQFQAQFQTPKSTPASAQTNAHQATKQALSTPPPQQVTTTRSGRVVKTGKFGNTTQPPPPPPPQKEQAPKKVNRSNSDSFPIISNVVSLAPQGNQQQVNAKSPSSVPVTTQQQGVKTTTTTTSTGNQTVQQQIIIQPPPPKMVKNKALLCKPITQTKATSCRPHTQTKETQTDGKIEPDKYLVPVPVPVYCPTPLAMYSMPTPICIPIPVPIPVPVFIPTTKKSASSILKQIKEIQEKIPADPLEAELLRMAEAVAGKEEESSSDSGDDAEPEAPPTKEPSNPPQGDLGEDMLQMALRMASEMSDEPVMDLETSLEPVAVSTVPPAPPTAVKLEEEDDDEYVPAGRQTRRGRGAASNKRQSRSTPRRSAKRQKVSDQTQDTNDPATSPTQVAPPLDANFHLKYTYGVNAYKHWVMQKNTIIEQQAKPATKNQKTFKLDLLQCTPEELNHSLCLFVKEVRKPNGEMYAVDSIYYLTLGIQQYLFENGRIDNIFTDFYYERFNDTLNEQLTRYEPKLNHAGQLVCRIEEEHLWESKQLGAHSPYVLLNSLVYFNTKFFMLKTSEDHLKLSFTHIMKHWKKNPLGRGSGTGVNAGRSVYLRYYCPTPQGKSVDNTQKKKKEEMPVYEQTENFDNPLRCPVKLYEFYLSKCPESIKNRNDTFYLVPERSCVPDSPVWYSTAMLGIDQMAKMLNRIRLVREIQEAHLHTQPVYI